MLWDLKVVYNVTVDSLISYIKLYYYYTSYIFRQRKVHYH